MIDHIEHHGSVIIKEQTYVDSSSGIYNDRVLCDVVPMTCCDVILGRPWQASRQTIHYGLENVYVVHKDGKTYTLTPLPNHVADECRNILVFGSKNYVDL